MHLLDDGFALAVRAERDVNVVGFEITDDFVRLGAFGDRVHRVVTIFIVVAHRVVVEDRSCNHLNQSVGFWRNLIQDSRNSGITELAIIYGR